MEEQITLSQLYSKCTTCFREEDGRCWNTSSIYYGMQTPFDGCKNYDGITGGIDICTEATVDTLDE